MINMIVLYKGLLLYEFYVNIHKMTKSDVAIFDKVKCSTSFLNASSLVHTFTEAMILKRHDHITRTVTVSKRMGSFIGFSTRLLSQISKSYGVRYK